MGLTQVCIHLLAMKDDYKADGLERILTKPEYLVKRLFGKEKCVHGGVIGNAVIKDLSQMHANGFIRLKSEYLSKVDRKWPGYEFLIERKEPGFDKRSRAD